MKQIINKNSKIRSELSYETKSINKAIQVLIRDMDKVFLPSIETGMNLCLREGNQESECFQIQVKDNLLEIQANDEMGFVYGIYEVSRSLLGVTNFWFWNDQEFEKRQEVILEDAYEYKSKPFAVKLRGWFVNDEVLLHTWSLKRNKELPWEMVFEALLRCGGNMVIPGTDLNSKRYKTLASNMGLSITHHHAEPLGAEMFARAYPELNPSYAEHGEKFEALWREGIRDQKDLKVVWNLGFRGQGDCPFWVNDPQYATNEARGALMSQLIKVQYDMLKEQCPGAICCTNLYGETMELYQEGFLNIPEDVIKIWADNGFGKMVTRRQGNHNPRVVALPKQTDTGKHGIYYHVSFYDLQAANHMTMLQNSPGFVNQELEHVLRLGVEDYWIINCSNVKPHVYYLDFIAEIWRNGSVQVKDHRTKYTKMYYGEEDAKKVSLCLEDYHKYAIPYGEHEDEHAGEQFTNHVARILISTFMKHQETAAKELLWARNVATLAEQIHWYRDLCEKGSSGYLTYVNECEQTRSTLSFKARRLFTDSILLQAKIHAHCYQGATYVCDSLLYAKNGEYQKAFYFAGKAREEYSSANQAMRECEHGKWNEFYANECLTDMKQTAWVLKGLMSYLRNLGDGPHYFEWQREFLYSEEDKRVMLVLNMENHLEDEEIYKLMKERWDS